MNALSGQEMFILASSAAFGWGLGIMMVGFVKMIISLILSLLVTKLAGK